MMKINVDLGRENGDPACMPEKSPETYYPSLYLDGIEDLPDLPREGTMVVRFKRTSKNVSENEEGEEKYSCCLEIQEIISVDGAADPSPTKRDTKTADALDAIASALKKKA